MEKERGQDRSWGWRMWERRRKEEFGVLQRADSLLWCRDAMANENHTHACTHTHTHTHTHTNMPDYYLVHTYTHIPSPPWHTSTRTHNCRGMPSTMHDTSFDLWCSLTHPKQMIFNELVTEKTPSLTLSLLSDSEVCSSASAWQVWILFACAYYRPGLRRRYSW